MSSLHSLLTPDLPNPAVQHWLAEQVELCRPARVRLLDGSPAERRELLAQAVAEGVLIELNQKKLPGCYLHRSNPNDVARTEQCTFICTPSEDAGRADQQLDGAASQAYARLRGLFAGCMQRPDHVRRSPSSWARSARRWPRSACS